MKKQVVAGLLAITVACSNLPAAEAAQVTEAVAAEAAQTEAAQVTEAVAAEAAQTTAEKENAEEAVVADAEAVEAAEETVSDADTEAVEAAEETVSEEVTTDTLEKAADDVKTSGSYKYKIASGSVSIVGTTEENPTVLTIPETLDGYTVTAIAESAFENCTTLTQVTLPATLTAINNYAFNNCQSLESIVIPDNVIKIGNKAFAACGKLKSVQLGRALVTLGQEVFKDCTGLEQVTVNSQKLADCSNSHWDAGYRVFANAGTASLNGMKVTFGADCISVPSYLFCPADDTTSGLTEVELSSSVQEIGNGAFEDCKKLNKVSFGNVKTIGKYAFKDTLALESITLPETVTEIKTSAFENSGLKQLNNLPSSLTSIGEYGFYNCQSLESVIVPDNVIKIDNSAFASCAKLKSVHLGRSLVTLGKTVFMDCTGLGQITINSVKLADCSNSHWDAGYKVFANAGTANTVGMTVTFGADCTYIPAYLFCPDDATSGLTTADFGSSVSEVGAGAFEDCKKLNKVSFGNVKTIGKWSFKNALALETISLPETVISLGNYSFENTGIKELVNMPGSLTTMGEGAFYSCKNLENAVLPDNIVTLGTSAFETCGKLKSVYLGRSLVTLGKTVFKDCTNLAQVTINSVKLADCSDSKWDNGYKVFANAGTATTTGIKVTFGENCTYVPNWLFYADDTTNSLTEVDLGSSVQEIGSGAFQDCKKLKQVSFGNVKKIGKWAFKNDLALETVALPGTLAEIGEYAFENTSIKDLTSLPGALTTLGEGAFYNNSKLTAVVIPDGVTTIGSSCFSKCSMLKDVTLGKGLKTLGNYAFDSCIRLENLTIHSQKIEDGSSRGYQVFYSAGSITDGVKVVFSDSCTYIPAYLFWAKDGYMPNIASVSIGNNVAGIGAYAFSNAIALKNIDLKNVKEIKKGAFSGCTGLTDICIGKGVTLVESCAFENCTNLKLAAVLSKTTELGSDIWNKCASDLVVECYHDSTTEKYVLEEGHKISYLDLGEVTVTKTENTANGSKISWNQVSGASGYYVYRRSNVGAYNLVKTVNSGSTTSYTDAKKGLKEGTLYQYKVVAFGKSFLGKDIVSTTFKTGKNAYLAQTKLTKASASGKRKITVKAAKSKKAGGYEFQYCMDKSFKGKKYTAKTSGASKVSTKITKNLTSKKKYYVRVRTYKKVSGKNYYSAWSNVKAVKVK